MWSMENVVAVFGSLLLWLAFWPTHRDKPGEGDLVIKVPLWLSWLCGRPRKDSKLELSAMIAQIGFLSTIVLWLCLKALGFDQELRGTVSGSMFTSALVVPFAVHIVVRIIRAKKGRT